MCCTDPTTRFFDRSRRLLYFWPNVSTSSAAPEHGDDDGDEEEASELMSPPPSDGSLLAVWLPMLINVTATQEKPAKGISFRGIGFRDAAYTFMHPHGMPSGGDWNLQRHAALFTEGTEQLEVDRCVFERLDGNAVAISGYARNATVSGCSFSWIGDSAIVSWGYTSGAPVPGMGPNASDGNHPMHNQPVMPQKRQDKGENFLKTSCITSY